MMIPVKTIDIHTGEVAAANGSTMLIATAIGSCVAVVAYDAGKKIGGMAHVMLPGEAPPKCDKSQMTRYTTNAMDEMLRRMMHLGVRRDNIKAVLIGAANVLQREDDVVCSNNIASVTDYLTNAGICIHKKVLGGIKRRSVSLDVNRGLLRYSEGDNGPISHSLVRQRVE